MDAYDRQLVAHVLLVLRWGAAQVAKYLTTLLAAVAVAALMDGATASDLVWVPLASMSAVIYGWFGLMFAGYLAALLLARNATPTAFRVFAVVTAPACNLLAVIAVIRPNTPLVAVLLGHLVFGAWVAQPGLLPAPDAPDRTGARRQPFRDGVYRPFG